MVGEKIDLEGDSSVTIENPDAPVNLDMDKMPPPKTVEIVTKDEDYIINQPTKGEI